MGDTSRDTFRELNTLHQLLSGEAVSDPRHYVGVRIQQGVPVLDADWNELEDIRRFDLRACFKYYIGNGIPSDNSGFQIGPVTEDNNFSINPGQALVEGMLVINHHLDLTYTDQASLFDVVLDALAPPALGEGFRDDLVYLDVWEEEIGPNDTVRGDARLINPFIGVETSRRLERRWLVRVAPGITDIAAVPQEPGHAYMALALLRRNEEALRILASHITDLRRTDFNVARYLKIPVYAERGTTIVDGERLAQLLDALRTIYFDRLAANQLFINLAPAHDQTIMHFAIQHIAQVCSTGALQARTNNLTNADALALLETLTMAQNDFLTQLANHGNGDGDTADFINDYSNFIIGGPGADGIEPALADSDLVGAYQGQQVLNAWLSAEGGTLPEGDILVQFLSISPFEALAAGQPYELTVEFTSLVTSSLASEVFDVTVQLSSNLWAIDRTGDEIVLDNEGGTGQLFFTLVPNAANNTCEVEVVATARRNPTGVISPTSILPLEIGVIPPVGATLLYAGPPLNVDGRLELSSALLNLGLAGVGFALNNRTPTSHSYTLRYNLSLDGGPDSAPQERTLVVGAGSIRQEILNFGAPTGETIGPDDLGTLHVTLIRIDGVELDPADTETVEVNFIAT